ncbi:MAG: (Fe-S)-binding protein [Pseudomonadota bacterium]
MSTTRRDTDAHAREHALCTYCPKMCRAVCPVGTAEARETTSTWGKMWQAFRCAEHGEPIDAEVARVFDACTGCGACTAFCEHGVDAASALVAMRARAYQEGWSVRADLLAERFDRLSRCTDQDLGQLDREEITAAPSSIALLPGAQTLLRRPGLAGLTCRVLSDLGAGCGALPDLARGLDVGQSLYWSGLLERFDAHAQNVAAALTRVATVVCVDPEDAYFLGVIYPRRGVSVTPRISTVVEELGRVVDRLVLRPGPVVAYHDSCHLGRRLGAYVAPRRIIERVLGEPPLEYAWTREHAECAGGGGLYLESNPEGALAIATRRWNSRPQGAQAIVTTCPTAVVLLRRAGGEALDVIELVAGERLP